MIEYESSSTASVRCGEGEIGGRRIAAVAVPYAGDGPGRFDPVGRRLVERRPGARVTVGPAQSGAWERAFVRCPAGPVLVGPGSPVEEVRGAGRAAAEGALAAGRGVYLLDPDPAALPDGPAAGLVVLASWTPGTDFARVEPFEAARSRGVPAGGVFPIVPGWTDDASFLDSYLSGLASRGATFAAGVAASSDGDARRALVEARQAAEPGAADRFFDTVYHADWPAALRAGFARFRAAAARLRLAPLPPRPLGPGESPANSAAAGRLEERAIELEDDEHRAALLLAAARWIDESARDLAAVVREGNFGKIFPFGALTAEAEAALREARP